MKKNLFFYAMLFIAISVATLSCKKDDDNEPSPTPDPEPSSQFVGVYDLDMVYDSVTDSEGKWFENEFFEQMTGKRNPPESGYLTIVTGDNGKLNVTATFYNHPNEGEEKVFFSTTATEKDNILILDPCQSDYYYDSTETMIDFIFRNFENNLPQIKFKSIYTINLGADYSYLNSYTCTKRN